MIVFLIKGGWALWVITAASVVALGVTLERWWTLRRANIDSEGLLAQLAKPLDRNDIEAAIALCNEAGGPVGETLGIGLRKLRFLERIGKRPEEIEEGIVAAMEEHGGHVLNYLERNLTTLATVASLAPILGMMGTVVGMIKAFGSISAAGNLTPAAVGVGISEALLCTAGGLIVAAMATVEYNYFTTRVNHFALKVQAAAARLVEKVVDTQSQNAEQLRKGVP